MNKNIYLLILFSITSTGSAHERAAGTENTDSYWMKFLDCARNKAQNRESIETCFTEKAQFDRINELKALYIQALSKHHDINKLKTLDLIQLESHYKEKLKGDRYAAQEAAGIHPWKNMNGRQRDVPITVDADTKKIMDTLESHEKKQDSAWMKYLACVKGNGNPNKCQKEKHHFEQLLTTWRPVYPLIDSMTQAWGSSYLLEGGQRVPQERPSITEPGVVIYLAQKDFADFYYGDFDCRDHLYDKSDYDEGPKPKNIDIESIPFPCNHVIKRLAHLKALLRHTKNAGILTDTDLLTKQTQQEFELLGKASNLN